MIGMAWSGVGQLDSTLTAQQKANSNFVRSHCLLSSVRGGAGSLRISND